MRFLAIVRAAALATAIAAPAQVMGQAPAPTKASPDRSQFPRQLEDFVARMAASPHAPPGFVVVAVHGGDTVFEKAYGVRDMATGAPMTLDTPVYNASITKAYTGLLASILDAEGVLPLNASLKDVWPQITFGFDRDPSTVRIDKLLSHSAGLRDDGLVFRTVVTGEFDTAMVPGHLAGNAIGAPQTFSYDNLGPFIYSAMVETRTGEPWREAVTRRVFRPLGLTRTTARLEDFPANEIAYCNVRGDGWSRVPHKPTPVLNAAGGMYASGRDTAKYLKVFLTDGRSAGGAIPAPVLRRTWQPVSPQDRDFQGTKRDGYGLGWDLGTYENTRFVSRSGTFTGCRSVALFLPEQGMGITVLTAGDQGMNPFNFLIVKQAIDLWIGHPEAAKRAVDRVTKFDADMAAPAARLKAAAARLRNPVRLEPAQLAAIAGTYENTSSGRLRISDEDGRLAMRIGIWTGEVVAIGADEYRTVQRGVAVSDAFKLERDAAGAIVAVEWEDQRWTRVRP